MSTKPPLRSRRQLRDEAEARLTQARAEGASPRASDELLHELQVHQIELEMQNETLRQTQVALEESRDRYLDLYDFAPVGYLTLNEAGMIVEANLTGAALLGVEREQLLRRRFSRFVAPLERERWNRLFIAALRPAKRSQIELTLERPGGGWQAHIDCLHVPAGTPPTVRVTLADVTQRAKLECELTASCQQIKDLSLRLLEVQENARRLLCAELHDRTSPNLAAVKINLEMLAALPPDEARKRAECLDDTRALVADTDNSIRHIASDLRPPLLDYAGLAPALRSYASQFSKRTGIAVNVDFVGVPTRMAPALESLLFRIFQEALTNCAKHARATTIAVALDCADRPATLTIEDNGIGFDAAPPRGPEYASGFGLLNMHELATLAGGRCVIDSRRGKGTRIRVEL